jgi:hypothetical protein
MMAAGRHFPSRNHHPRKRMIQYLAAFPLKHWQPGILDRPVKPGDDGCTI